MPAFAGAIGDSVEAEGWCLVSIDGHRFGTTHLGDSGDLCGAQLSARSPSPGVMLVSIVGELDMRSAPEAAHFLAPRVAARPLDLILDLSGATFLDSAGVTVLVQILQYASGAGVALHLTGVIGNDAVESVLELSRAVDVFDVHYSLAALLHDLDTGSAKECPSL
jgi:anti-sigma B factor antagonist